MKKVSFVLLTIFMVLSLIACSAQTENTAPGNSSTTSGASSASTAAPAPDRTKVSGTVRVSLAGWQLENGIDPISGEETVGLNQFLDEHFYPTYPNIKLEVSQIPWENVQAKHKALLLSQDVDILSTAGGWANELYELGLLRGINDLIAGDESFDPNQYLQGIWNFSYNTNSLDGTVRFGIPLALGRRMTVYDKQIFDDFDVEYLSDIPTPEEILEKAKKMTGINPRTGEQTYGLYIRGNSYDAPFFQALTRYYNAPGGQGTLNDLKNVKFELDTPEMAKVFEWISEAVQYVPGGFLTNHGLENFGLPENNIAIALDNGGTSPWGQYMSSKDDSILERFVPVMNIGPNGQGYVAVDPIIMAKDVGNVEAAWEVMKFFTGEEMQRYRHLTFSVTPTLKNVDFVDPKDQYIATAMKIADVAESNLMDELNPFFNSEVVPAVNGFLSSVANNQTPDIASFLQDLQDRAERWQKTLQ